MGVDCLEAVHPFCVESNRSIGRDQTPSHNKMCSFRRILVCNNQA